MKKKVQKLSSWGQPGALSMCRNQVGGDICAAALLYRLKYRWERTEKKLVRFGKEWLAMSRSDWATEAGLSEGEMKNRALPKLRKTNFVEIRQMKLNPSGPKLLWMHLDAMEIFESTTPWDMYELSLDVSKESKWLWGSKKTYPYQNDEEL